MSVRAAVMAVLLGLFLPACGGGGDVADIASSGASTSSSAPATTVPPTSVPPTSVPPATTTSVDPATSTTVLRPTTSRAPTTTGAVVARCENVPLTVEVSTERAAYRPIDAVRGHFALRNVSGAACLIRNNAFNYRVVDASGRAVGSAGAGHTDGFVDTTLAAGATDVVFDLGWDQMACSPTGTCSQAPPGTYTARATITVSGTVVEGSATFRLVAA